MNPTKLYDLKKEGKVVGVKDTFTARIFVGFLDTEQEFERPMPEAQAACQEFVEERGLCVNVQETFFQYGSDGEGGNERGAVVELIHYPRFPRENPKKSITNQALELANDLMIIMNQKRCSVVTTDETFTLQNPNHEDVS